MSLKRRLLYKVVFFFYFCLLYIFQAVRYFIEISYLGSNFHGWQLQENATSIQGEVESALSTILNQKIGIHGSSRTDTGVHARQQFAHFTVENPLSNLDSLLIRLNRLLHQDIAIENIYPVKDDAHTRFDAIGRKYIYRIVQKKDPFSKSFSALYNRELDLERMNAAASILLKHTDFKSFSRVRTAVLTYNCDIQVAEWKWNEHVLEFHITANRFLRGMVRAIVGTMLNVGIGKTSLEEFDTIILSQDRTKAGMAVKAVGLTLERVYYPENYFKLDKE